MVAKPRDALPRVRRRLSLERAKASQTLVRANIQTTLTTLYFISNHLWNLRNLRLPLFLLFF